MPSDPTFEAGVRAGLEAAARAAHERGESWRLRAEAARRDEADRARQDGLRAMTCYHLRDAIRSIDPSTVKEV